MQALCGALDIEKVSRHSFADEDILGSCLSLFCSSRARQSGCLYFRMHAGSPQRALRRGCTWRGEESCDNIKWLLNCSGDLGAPWKLDVVKCQSMQFSKVQTVVWQFWKDTCCFCCLCEDLIWKPYSVWGLTMKAYFKDLGEVLGEWPKVTLQTPGSLTGKGLPGACIDLDGNSGSWTF